MKRYPQNDLIILFLSKRSLLAIIGAIVSLAMIFFSACSLSEYLIKHIDVSPFAALAFTNNNERIGTMTGTVINNSDDTGLAGDVYTFKGVNDGNAVHVWHLTTGNYDYEVHYEDTVQSREVITLEYNSNDRGEFVIQPTYYSYGSGYNYTGEGKLMFVSFNIPRPYGWHGQNFNLRSYYKIEWDVHNVAPWLHITYCAMLLFVLLVSTVCFSRILFSRIKILYRSRHLR